MIQLVILVLFTLVKLTFFIFGIGYDNEKILIFHSFSFLHLSIDDIGSPHQNHYFEFFMTTNFFH